MEAPNAVSGPWYQVMKKLPTKKQPSTPVRVGA